MGERPQGRLRVEPHMIPALRAAFSDAAKDVSSELDKLGREGELPGPWLGDPVSEDIARRYSALIMNGDASAYGCLCAYRDELLKVADALAQMEVDYRTTDAAAATRMGTGYRTTDGATSLRTGRDF